MIKKKYVNEILRWKQKAVYKDKVAGDGYPKTPISPKDYELYREEGEEAQDLFSTHYIKGRVV